MQECLLEFWHTGPTDVKPIHQAVYLFLQLFALPLHYAPSPLLLLWTSATPQRSIKRAWDQTRPDYLCLWNSQGTLLVHSTAIVAEPIRLQIDAFMP